MIQAHRLKKHVVILITLLLITGILFSSVAVCANAADINGHWAEAIIKTWSDEELISAYPDGMFKPDRHISRAEFISMTNRAFHFIHEADHSFNDVGDDQWYSGEIRRAVQVGYIKGYSDGTMRPDSSVTRQEVAVILARLLNLSPNEDEARLLTDAESIPTWSKGPIGAVFSAGIIKGYPDGRFGPVAEMTRAEAVVALERARNHVTAFEAPGTYGPAEGTELICGHVYVKADGAILQNLVITGDLIITEEVGKGDVTLNDITVYGDTYIRGGGKDSIHINGGVFRNVIVQNVDGQVRIVATAVNGLAVVIAEDAAGEAVILEGSFTSVVLDNVGIDIVTQGRTSIGEITVSGNSASTVISLSERTTVGSMVLESSAKVKGSGTVIRAEIKADGVSFEKPPSEQIVAPGVNPPATTPPASLPPPTSPPLATYTLTVQTNPAGGGSAADNTAAGPYAEGVAVEVTAAANAGYEFISWTSGASIVSTDAAFTYAMPAANTTLTANFLPMDHVPIANAGELSRVRYDAENTFGEGTAFEGTYRGGLDKKYIQVADIDLNTAPYNTDEGWTPLGTAWTIAFTGIYDGNGYRIDNLFINRPSADGIGLFGYVGEQGQLVNIILTNANVTGSEEVGILVGASEGHIENCSSAGQVSGSVDTGGLVGISYNFDKPEEIYALIRGSHSSATVQNSLLYGGGLVGSNYGKVENCYATGAVTGSDFSSGGYTGGLVGQNFGMVTDSYATGDVNGDGAGGLVGDNYRNSMASKFEAKILNSYATGNVAGDYTVGGLVGYSFNGTIDNCYATGNVSGMEAVAGLVGGLSDTSIDKCFALNGTITRTSGTNTYFARAFCESAGGNTVGVIYARNDMAFEGVSHVIDTAMGSGDGMELYRWITDNNTLVQIYGEDLFLFTHWPYPETLTTTSVAGNITDFVSAYTDFCPLLMSGAKVISAETAAAAGAFSGWSYDTIPGKTEAENLALGDILLTKSRSGALRTYEIAVIEYVMPIMSGTVTVDGVAKFGMQLTADISDITYDPLTADDAPDYQWHRNGLDIDSATASTYTLAEDDIGKTISVTVTADGTHAMGSVTSAATAAVEKADGPASPAAPGVASKGKDSVILVANANQQFSIDGGTWQDSNEFTGLSPNTAYTFRTRTKETATHEASQPSEPVSVQTLKTVAQLTAGDRVEFDGRDYFVLNPANGYLLSVNSINSATGALIAWGTDNTNPSAVKAFLDGWFEANIQNKDVVQDFGGDFGKIGLISTNDWNSRSAEVTNPDYIRIGRTWTSTKVTGNTVFVWQIKADGTLIQSSAGSNGDVRHAIKILSSLAIDTVDDKFVVVVP